MSILAQATTAENAKLVTDWQQTPIFVWEIFRALPNFLVSWHKKIRPSSRISDAIFIFFTQKLHIFDFRAVKYLFKNIF